MVLGQNSIFLNLFFEPQIFHHIRFEGNFELYFRRSIWLHNLNYLGYYKYFSHFPSHHNLWLLTQLLNPSAMKSLSLCCHFMSIKSHFRMTIFHLDSLKILRLVCGGEYMVLTYLNLIQYNLKLFLYLNSGFLIEYRCLQNPFWVHSNYASEQVLMKTVAIGNVFDFGNL